MSWSAMRAALGDEHLLPRRPAERTCAAGAYPASRGKARAGVGHTTKHDLNNMPDRVAHTSSAYHEAEVEPSFEPKSFLGLDFPKALQRGSDGCVASVPMQHHCTLLGASCSRWADSSVSGVSLAKISHSSSGLPSAVAAGCGPCRASWCRQCTARHPRRRRAPPGGGRTRRTRR